jgi:hypothetical protein
MIDPYVRTWTPGAMSDLASRMEKTAEDLFLFHDFAMEYSLFDHLLDIDRVRDIHDAGCDLQALAFRLRTRSERSKIVTRATRNTFDFIKEEV